MAETPGGRRYTVTQAGPLGAPPGRSGPVCLWRAARRLEEPDMGLIQELEAEAIAAFDEGKTTPELRHGDTLRVGVRVVEGERTRAQNYEGVCIARSNRGINSNLTARKLSFGEG